jgi:hypothetical protein
MTTSENATVRALGHTLFGVSPDDPAGTKIGPLTAAALRHGLRAAYRAGREAAMNEEKASPRRSAARVCGEETSARITR